MTELQKELFLLKDEDYKKFHLRLMPGYNEEKVIGIRMPVLKTFEKNFKNSKDKDIFLSSLPHKYYEENNLHLLLINEIKDFDECVKKIDIFLPHIDNWATCDIKRPKCFEKNKNKLLEYIKSWLDSDKTYTVRYAIGTLMDFYLKEDFNPEYLKLVCEKCCDEYYINMMIAWYFATALNFRYDEALKYLKERKLSKWVHNKTIQKALESFRIDDEKKKYLKKLKEI